MCIFREHGMLILQALFQARERERGGRIRAMELLKFVGIADRAHELSRNLPYGYQRRLEIARALATEPELLCLDEPAAGLGPSPDETPLASHAYGAASHLVYGWVLEGVRALIAGRR